MKSPSAAASTRARVCVSVGLCLLMLAAGCAPTVTVISEVEVAAAPVTGEPFVPEPLERFILGSFETAPCEDMTDVDGLDVEPECGWLSTPMFTRDVEIELPVVIFRATSDNPASDPIVYLHGGPAGGIVEYAAGQYETIVEPFLAERDVVLFDQRGSGLSEPTLECDPAQNFWSDPDADDDVEYIERRAKTCAWRLRNHGLDLYEFNKLRSADDVMVLARELGYDQINLIGTSWGGLLATTVMSAYPDLVRASLLNSPLSYETDLSGSMPASYLEALGAIQAVCDADESCVERHGDITARFSQVVEELDRDPLKLRLIGDSYYAGDDYRYTVELTGQEIVHLVFGLLYSPDAIASVPDLLLDIEARDPRMATRFASIYGWGWGFDFGFLTYMCTDVVPSSSFEAVNAQQTGEAAFDRIDDVPDGRGTTAPLLCDAMKVVPPAPEADPTPPDTPALVFSGRLDPITPFSSGVSLAQSLPQGTFVGFDDLSHGALQDACASRIAMDFFDAPTEPVDTECSKFREPFRIRDAALSVHEPNVFAESTTSEAEIGEQIVSVQVLDGYRRDAIEDLGTLWWRDDAPYDLTAFGLLASDSDGTAADEVDRWFGNMDAFEIGEETVLSFGGADWVRREALSPFGLSLVAMVRTDDEVALLLQAYPEELEALEQHIWLGSTDDLLLLTPN